jgi:hypothetical protein
MFYTYMWLRQGDATPYYVGKGKEKRAYRSSGHSVKRPKFDHLILVQYWESEEKAFEMEKWWIAFYGRKDNDTGCLRNLTEGGENPPVILGNDHAKGKKHSLEARIAKSIRQTGRLHTEETKRKLSIIRKGKATRGTGWHHSEGTKKKLSVAHNGFKHSEETIEMMRESRKGRNKGVPWSATRRDRFNKKEKKPKHMAPCHPDREHAGLGLCKPCYDKKYNEDKKFNRRVNEEKTSTS